MRAYSTDLREKIVLAYEGGEGTFDEIAETFGVARCTVLLIVWNLFAFGLLLNIVITAILSLETPFQANTIKKLAAKYS